MVWTAWTPRVNDEKLKKFLAQDPIIYSKCWDYLVLLYYPIRIRVNFSKMVREFLQRK